MKVLFTIACDGTSIDRESNRLSLFNILEDLHAASFPIIVGHVALVTMLERRQDEASQKSTKIRISIDERIIHEGDFPVDFSEHMRVRSVGAIGGLPIPQPGLLKLALVDGDDELGAWTIRVHQLPDPKVTVRSEPAAGEHIEPAGKSA